MIKVKRADADTFTVDLDVADRVVLSEIAVGFSISATDTLTAVINRGMDSLIQQLSREATRVTEKREAEREQFGG